MICRKTHCFTNKTQALFLRLKNKNIEINCFSLNIFNALLMLKNHKKHSFARCSESLQNVGNKPPFTGKFLTNNQNIQNKLLNQKKTQYNIN